MALFLFVGVPIVGRLLSSVMGRKLGALATGGAVGAIGWFLTASLLLAGRRRHRRALHRRRDGHRRRSRRGGIAAR